uniref:Retrotransposon Copia-like N-terminal domain-containing protein n=1 Tax=Nicotiana tabacum TaxID=4097 RepID=A0A1S4BBQ6_TOBAC|nr:PREDICTED: uncharacterized protein LOC107806626 [Nicotiana tabacum]
MDGDKDTSNTTNPSLDTTSPLYMHPSESAVTVLVPVVFDETSYRSWRRGVMRALSVKNKVGFITEKYKKPSSDDATFDQWARWENPNNIACGVANFAGLSMKRPLKIGKTRSGLYFLRSMCLSHESKSNFISAFNLDLFKYFSSCLPTSVDATSGVKSHPPHSSAFVNKSSCPSNDSGGVLMTQRKFANNLLKEYDCLGYTTVLSPLDSTIKLKAGEGPLLSDPILDNAYSVHHLSQFMQAPRDLHLKAALHVVRDLKHDLTLGIFLSKDPNYGLRAYCDSDWVFCPDSRKPVNGYIVLLGDSPISRKSKKQSKVSLSSAEAEYMSIRKVVGELVWVKRLMEELAEVCHDPIPVFCDSLAVVYIA